LYVLANGAVSVIFWVNSQANLYAGAPLQFTCGQFGCSGLCNDSATNTCKYCPHVLL
jgi:hypothetical protein